MTHPNDPSFPVTGNGNYSCLVKEPPPVSVATSTAPGSDDDHSSQPRVAPKAPAWWDAAPQMIKPWLFMVNWW